MRLAFVILCVGFAAGCDVKPTAESGSSSSPPPPVAENPAPAEVRLRKTDAGWEMSRNGSPYTIRGAGGEGSKELLARLGGNSVRTWGTDDLLRKLDDAHRHNLSVAVGIWLGHERHGFKYSDPAQIAHQRETVCETILKFKDHPAVLLWSLGNEMEGYGKGDSEAIWTTVNDLARLAKSLDPTHPTMTVIAEIGGQRIPCINRLCPDIDIVGLNSYAGASTLPRRYRDVGGIKPYILTEFGPPGPWEVEKTPWGAAIELSSSEKAIVYRRAYKGAVLDSGGLCLGSYAFIWGHKQETSATWFGILLPDGSRLAAADVLSTLWLGKPPPNRCPVIERLTLASGQTTFEPGAKVRATLAASDPDGDALTVRWVLQADALTKQVGGDAEESPPCFSDAILKSDTQGAEVRLPDAAGGYRLYSYVADGHGGAAVANIPLLVRGPAKPK